MLSLHFLEAGRVREGVALRRARPATMRASKYANVDAAEFYERALAAAGALRACRARRSRASARRSATSVSWRRELRRGGRRRTVRRSSTAAPARAPAAQAREGQRAARDATTTRSTLYDAGAADADADETSRSQLARAIVLYRQGHIDECARSRPRGRRRRRLALDDRATLADAYCDPRRSPRPSAAARHASSSSSRCRSSRSSACSDAGDRAQQHGRARLLRQRAGRRAIEYYRPPRNSPGAAGEVIGPGSHATNNRGEIRLDQGRLEEARELFESALRTYRAAKYPIGEGVDARSISAIWRRSRGASRTRTLSRHARGAARRRSAPRAT